jgi:hypothetical protein
MDRLIVTIVRIDGREWLFPFELRIAHGLAASFPNLCNFCQSHN